MFLRRELYIKILLYEQAVSLCMHAFPVVTV